MKITREFKGDGYDRNISEICSFWKGRGYTLRELDDDKYVGTRGHIVHNLFTISMDKLATSIVIDASGEGVRIEVDVNPFGTIMTKSEGAFWDTEFDMFESYLKKEEIDKDLMNHYNKRKNRVTFIIYATAVIFSLAIGFVVGGFLF